MKYILFLLAIVTLASCSNSKPDDSTTVFQKSSQNKQHYVQMYPPAGVDPKLVDDSVAVIKPTWGQSIYYANKSGTIIYKIIAIVLFAGFGFAVYKLTTASGSSQTFGYGLLLLGLLAGGLYSWYGKASTVKWNNTKEIDIDFYRSSVATDGSSLGVWDKLYDDNLLIGAASK